LKSHQEFVDTSFDVQTEILDDIKLALSLSGYTLTGVYTLNSVKSIHTFKLTILRDSGPFSDDEVGTK